MLTGIDLLNNKVYTNNPWGIKGEQSFYEFQNGYAGKEQGVYELQYVYIPLKKYDIN